MAKVAPNDADIRALMEMRIKAVRAKDVAALTANHAPDVLTFDLIDPLRNLGLTALRRRAQEWFASFAGGLDYEIRDLAIAAGEDVAFCHGLHRVGGTRTDGEKIEMWWRATIGFRRADGRWVITHEHSSVPFDMTSGKVSLDLKP
jgi:ketosteroid isomerase-like protein